MRTLEILLTVRMGISAINQVGPVSTDSGDEGRMGWVAYGVVVLGSVWVRWGLKD